MLQDSGIYGLSPKFDESSFKTFYSVLKIKLKVKNGSVQILRKLVAHGDLMSRNLTCTNSESTSHSNMKLCTVILPYLMFEICNC